jgi:hypothetical protein
VLQDIKITDYWMEKVYFLKGGFAKFILQRRDDPLEKLEVEVDWS